MIPKNGAPCSILYIWLIASLVVCPVDQTCLVGGCGVTSECRGYGTDYWHCMWKAFSRLSSALSLEDGPRFWQFYIFTLVFTIERNFSSTFFHTYIFGQQVQQRVAVGTRERPWLISGCQVASAAGRSVSRPAAAATEATRYGRYGRPRFYYCTLRWSYSFVTIL